MPLIDVFKPKSINDAKELLSRYEDVKILGGGTDLIIEIRKSKIDAQYLIDLGNIKELKDIKEDSDSVILGAMVSFSNIQESEILLKYFTMLLQCADMMGSPQIRNMATIGGNVINAGSAADIIPCLIALGATLVIESVSGIRNVSCEDYFKDYKNERVKNDELLTYICIKKRNALSGFYKLGKRNSLSIARVSAAVSISLEKNKIVDFKVALGAVGRFPFRVEAMETETLNKDIQFLLSEEATSIIEETVENSIKGRSTVGFKKEAVKGVYKIAIKNALASLKEDD